MPAFSKKIAVLFILLALPGGVLPAWHLLTCHQGHHQVEGAAEHTEIAAGRSDKHPSAPSQPRPVESHPCPVCWQIHQTNLTSVTFCTIHTTEFTPAEQLAFEVYRTPAQPLCLHHAQRAPPTFLLQRQYIL